MTELRVRDLGKVRKALEEAARVDASTAKRVVKRYIELRPGIQNKLEAERNHLLTGRRGTGKSTLLSKLHDHLRSQNVAVANLDMERFNGRAYPDVLIEVLIALLDELRPNTAKAPYLKRRALRRRLDQLKSVLVTMLRDPQQLVTTMSNTRQHERAVGAGAAISAAYKAQKVSVSAATRRGAKSETVVVGKYEELKIERLQTLAGDVAKLLKDVVSSSSSEHAMVFLDDYYFVPFPDQPAVLAYMQQITKGTGIWLKVGGVGSRLNTYRDGQPPVGMELGQDISEVALDVTLAEFNTAKRFLEDVLDGVLADFNLTTKDLFTGDARDRMVLACGGAVARDYVTLTESCLDEAVERLSKENELTEDASIKIWTVDIQGAVKKQMNTKEKEAFQRDAESDATALSNRWRDIGEFIRTTDDYFILVPQADLEREQWGQEIRQLENLRLIHRIKDTIPNAESWKGVKTMVFMIDLGQIPNVRLSKKIIPFWTGAAEFNHLRRSGWVYTPDWRERQKDARPLVRKASTGSTTVATADDDVALFGDDGDLAELPD